MTQIFYLFLFCWSYKSNRKHQSYDRADREKDSPPGVTNSSSKGPALPGTVAMSLNRNGEMGARLGGAGAASTPSPPRPSQHGCSQMNPAQKVKFGNGAGQLHFVKQMRNAPFNGKKQKWMITFGLMVAFCCSDTKEYKYIRCTVTSLRGPSSPIQGRGVCS